jgi:pimeloyl-ACP methyl ester carboxylesterase
MRSFPALCSTVRGYRSRRFRACQIMLVVLLGFLDASTRAADPPLLPGLAEVRITSSLDGSDQPSLYWAPENARSEPTPLLVFLHSWSGNYRQKNDAWLREAVERGWIYMHPDFRGRNDTPQACGSRLARQDVLDAIAFARKQFRVDSRRIYLAGTSGGGHMSMLMAGHHPTRFSAVSAWVGISDISEWYRFHLKDGEPQNYARMILKSLGGPPGESPDRDADYRDRSPVFHLNRVGDLPIEVSAGIRDGHSGSVPISHSLLAWNEIVRATDGQPVSADEIQRLTRLGGQAVQLTAALDNLPVDESLGRKIVLRNSHGGSRVTIFDGGHEGIAAAACDWLSRHDRLVE